MWEVKLRVVLVIRGTQEADYRAIGSCEETNDIAIVVDASSRRVGASGRNEFLEMTIVERQFVGMVDTFAIRVEANCHAVIIEAEQLIDRSCASVGVAVRGVDAVMSHKAEVDAITINPEACCVSVIVDRDDLCLHRAREVLIFVVVLCVGRIESVSLVRMSCCRATTKVACDNATVVDTQQLVKGRISLIIEGLKPIGILGTA